MPRKARITLPHIAHHITQRGNYQQIIFEEESDYKKYLLWCKEYSEKYKLEILVGRQRGQRPFLLTNKVFHHKIHPCQEKPELPCLILPTT